MIRNIAEYLPSYGTSIHYEDIPQQVIQKVKALLIDILACGIDAYNSKPGKMLK